MKRALKFSWYVLALLGWISIAAHTAPKLTGSVGLWYTLLLMLAVLHVALGVVLDILKLWAGK